MIEDEGLIKSDANCFMILGFDVNSHEIMHVWVLREM